MADQSATDAADAKQKSSEDMKGRGDSSRLGNRAYSTVVGLWSDANQPRNPAARRRSLVARLANADPKFGVGTSDHGWQFTVTLKSFVQPTSLPVDRPLLTYG